MEGKEMEARQDLKIPSDGPPSDPEASMGVEALRAENELLWRAVEQYAPQVVELLAESGDTEMPSSGAERLPDSPSHHPHIQNSAPAAGAALEGLASELAREVVDSLFDPKPAPSLDDKLGDVASNQREAGRLEEHARQRVVRRGTVERGSAERREPAFTLDDRGKEVARALGISEAKLANAAAERLRIKGVLR